jgi:hypothetical protein
MDDYAFYYMVIAVANNPFDAVGIALGKTGYVYTKHKK